MLVLSSFSINFMLENVQELEFLCVSETCLLCQVTYRY